MLRLAALLAFSLAFVSPAHAGRSEYRPHRSNFSHWEWGAPMRYWDGERQVRRAARKAKPRAARKFRAGRPARPSRFRTAASLSSRAGRSLRSPALVALVKAAAEDAGVPVKIALAVVAQESGFRPHLTGSAGEVGLAQIKPATARSLGFRGPRAALFEPRTNLRYGMRYLALALRRGGPGCHGVTLYNSGIYARPHCSRYGRRVMARAQ